MSAKRPPSSNFSESRCSMTPSGLGSCAGVSACASAGNSKRVLAITPPATDAQRSMAGQRNTPYDAQTLRMSLRRRAALAVGSAALSLLTLSQPALAEEAPEWQPAAEDEIKPHHGRSLIEMGVGLAAGSILYWVMM